MPDNPIWDALEEVLGYEPKAHEFKLWGKISRDLAAAGATRETVHRAAHGYRQMFPQVAMTITAFLKHYSQALAYDDQPPSRPPQRTTDFATPTSIVPLEALQAAARGDYERAKELGS